MKITKKLRDVTEKEYSKWKISNCNSDAVCAKCPFFNVNCDDGSRGCWVFNKDMYSDKFLDQTIEVEVPDILTKEEKEYLSAVIKPFRNQVTHIAKVYWTTPKRKFIEIECRENIIEDRMIVSLYFPYLPNDEMYKGMEDNRPYTLEELGL